MQCAESQSCSATSCAVLISHQINASPLTRTLHGRCSAVLQEMYSALAGKGASDKRHKQAVQQSYPRVMARTFAHSRECCCFITTPATAAQQRNCCWCFTALEVSQTVKFSSSVWSVENTGQRDEQQNMCRVANQRAAATPRAESMW